MFGLSRSSDQFMNLLARARLRHGELAHLLLPVFEERWRQTNITRRRAQVKNEDHRFFLALLLNVPERPTVLRLVTTFYSEAAVARGPGKARKMREGLFIPCATPAEQASGP